MSIFSLFSQSLTKETYVFFDTETTGLYPLMGDRIIEIAMIKTKDGNKVDELQLLINPGKPIPEEVSNVNHITDDMVRSMPQFNDDIADKILDFIDGAILVAHNAAFDIGFLSYEFARLGRVWIKWSAVDTLQAAYKALPSLPKKNLGALCRYYNVVSKEESSEFHRALFDTEALMNVFYKMMDNEQEFMNRDIDYLINNYGFVGKNMSADIPAVFREAMIEHRVIDGQYKRRDGKIVDLSVKLLAPVWAQSKSKKEKWYLLGETTKNNNIVALVCQNFLNYN